MRDRERRLSLAGWKPSIGPHIENTLPHAIESFEVYILYILFCKQMQNPVRERCKYLLGIDNKQLIVVSQYVNVDNN